MNIGFFITARFKSKRLPLKLLKDLNGRSVIERVIDRAKKVEGVLEVVLCTSTNPQDAPLIDIAKKNGISYFAGSPDDILDRFLSAARAFRIDGIVNISADNPLFSIEYADILARVIEESRPDFIKISGLPLGCATYGIAKNALEVVCKVKEIADLEIWGYMLDQPSVFKVRYIEAQGNLKRPELRLTLDYDKDYELINNIYGRLAPDKVLSLYDVIDYLDENPAMAGINALCVQRSLDPEIKKSIDDLFSSRKDIILQLKDEIYGRV